MRRVRLARYDQAWLKSATARLTARLRMGEGDPRRRRALEARDAEEQRELDHAAGRGEAGGQLQQPQLLPGRQTGSLAWRAARGELGADPAAEAAAAAAAAAAADAAASPCAPTDASAAGAVAGATVGGRTMQIPGVKPLPDDLVAAAATRVLASADQDKLDVIRRVLTNVVNDPNNGKYRRLKMSNAKIAAAVGGGTFGKELLVALGFVAKNDAKDGLVFVLGPGGADVLAAVPAIQLALGKMEEGNRTPGATGAGGEGGEGGSGSSVSAVTNATGKLNIVAHGAPATGSASTPAPAPAPAASSADLAKEALRKAVHAEFTRLVNDEGVAANEAAAMAINNVRAKMTAKAATATPVMVAAAPNVAR